MAHEVLGMGTFIDGYTDEERRHDSKKYYTHIEVKFFEERQGIFRKRMYVIEPRMYNGYGEYVSPHETSKVWKHVDALIADNIPIPNWWQRPFWWRSRHRYELRLREHAISIKLMYVPY